jgi:hypothetical protein
MFDDHHEPLRRPRPRSRLNRQGPPASAERSSTLVAARRVACDFVADHWPELAAVKPTVSTRQHHVPDHELMQRLGLAESEIVLARPGVEYTFTFASEAQTVDGYVRPQVAAVTVDAEQHVVKTMVSR